MPTARTAERVLSGSGVSTHAAIQALSLALVAKRSKPYGGRWKVIGNLGEGGQAHTFRVRDLEDGSTGWVLKRLKNTNRLDRFGLEIDALARLTSSHIPRIVDSAISDDVSYLVTPYVGKDLTRLPDIWNPRAVFERFRGIVTAVHDAHAQGVIHRDIKPNNVVVDEEGKPYLVDFGICADMESEVVLTTTIEGFGNAAFAAPECGAGSVDAASEASDVYSLGKVLYWMTSGKKVFVRERYDPETLTVTDPHVAQYVSMIMDRTVREEPSSRWTSTDLLRGIDWVIAKMDEHSSIRTTGRVVLTDGFGPDNDCNRGSSRSATGAARGNPPAHHDIAESFFVRDPVALDQIDIGVRARQGSGKAEVLLAKGELAAPSESEEDVLERWPINIAEPNTLQVLQLQSARKPTLGPHEIYWVILSAVEDDSDVAWISAADELKPRVSWIAERDRPADWQSRESRGGPGLAFRVLGRLATEEQT
jgi:serine/threonine protein kinase